MNHGAKQNKNLFSLIKKTLPWTDIQSAVQLNTNISTTVTRVAWLGERVEGRGELAPDKKLSGLEPYFIPDTA